MGDSASTVSQALAEVEQWRKTAEQASKREMVALSRESDSLRVTVQNLMQQLEALKVRREVLEGEVSKLEHEELSRSYTAIFSSLSEQVATIARRANEVATVESSRRVALAEAMSDSSVAPLLEEYRQFKDSVEPTLQSLPESYRKLVTQHHEGVVARLREHMGRAAGGVTEIDGEEVRLDIVFAIDAMPGETGVLMVVVPVAEQVYTQWSSRDEDLQTWLVARVVQALAMLFRGTPQEQSRIVLGPCQGMLAIELDLGEQVPQFLGEHIKRAVGAVIDAAPEMTASKVRIVPHEVGPDQLFPPEEAGDVG